MRQIKTSALKVLGNDFLEVSIIYTLTGLVWKQEFRLCVTATVTLITCKLDFTSCLGTPNGVC